MKITKTLRQVVGVVVVGAALAFTGSAAHAQSSGGSQPPGGEGQISCAAIQNLNNCGSCYLLSWVSTSPISGCCDSGTTYAASGNPILYSYYGTKYKLTCSNPGVADKTCYDISSTITKDACLQA